MPAGRRGLRSLAAGLAQESGGRSAAEHQLVQRIVIGSHINAVHVEEYERARRTRVLVPVEERVVARDMELVGPCHREDVLVQVLPRVHRFRHGDCGYE